PDGEPPTLGQLQLDINDLKKENLSFFLPNRPKQSGSVHSRLLKNFRSEELRFFIDPRRKRPLCADVKKTILNRGEFANILNEYVGGDFTEDFRGRDEKEIQERIKKTSDHLKKILGNKETRHDADDLGVGGPSLKTAAGLAEIAENLDLASIEQLKAAGKKGFHWIRIEPDTVRLGIPATPECAQQIAGHPKTSHPGKE